MKRPPQKVARKKRAKVQAGQQLALPRYWSGWIIRASRSPYGPRPRWGPLQYCQAAIVVITHGRGPPVNFNASQLTRDVRDQLAKDPEAKALGLDKSVSRQTVLRAVKLLRDAKLEAWLNPVPLD